jgi:uncharacterized protein
MLEFLMVRGEVAIAGRAGRERLWDLAERVYPADVDVPSVEEAEQKKNERRLALLGIAGPKAREMPIEPVHVGEAGEPAVVEGVKGEWRVDPSYLGDDFEGRAVAVRPAGPRPGSRRGALRFRVHARDVQAPGQAALGLLRPPGAPPRAADREGRRSCRPRRLGAARACHPSGRHVHARDDERRPGELEDLATWLRLDAVEPARADAALV